MNISSTKKLNNGVEMPVLGLGVYQSGRDTYNAVRYALDTGYTHIDTASIYENEQEVGKAIKDSGINRKDIFLTTKLWTTDMRSHKTKEAFEKSLSLLGMDYVDLYLIHWPVENEYIYSYKVMENLYSQGKTRAIGVSNFLVHHLENLIKNVDILPAVDQFECHPYLTSTNVLNKCFELGINPESWSPIAKGKIMQDVELQDLSTKYSRTVSQIVLKWQLQRGSIIIPKSVHKERIIENSRIFDFDLLPEDMNKITNLDCNKRLGSHPDKFIF